MSKNIKGVTIEIDGDVSGLTQALKKVDGETKKIQTELKQVDNLLKLDPKNTVLLAQKQELLSGAITNTSKRLDALKQAQGDVERQFKNGEIGEEAYRRFQRELVATEGKLEAFKKQAKSVEAKLDVETNTSKLDKAKSEMKQLGDTAKTVGKEIGQELKKGFEVGAKAVAGIGAAAIGAVAGVGVFVESQKEMNMDLARLRTNAETAGFSLESIEAGFKKVSAVTGEADSAIETMSNLMATDFSEAELAEALDYINGAAIKFSDTLKTEGIADGIQETFATGKAIGPFAELLERSGVNIEEFDKGLAKASKSGEQTTYMLQELSKLGLASTYEEYQNNNKALSDYNEAQLESQLKMADLATKMQPFVTSLIQLGNVILDVVLGTKTFAEGFSEISNVISGVTQRLITVVSEAMPKFIQGFLDALPQIMATGQALMIKLLEGIASKLPMLAEKALEIIKLVTQKQIENLPKLLEAGVRIVTTLIQGITNLLPKIQSTAGDLLSKLVGTIISNLPQIISAAFRIVTSLISGLGQAIPKMLTYLVTSFIPSIFKAFLDADWLAIGKAIVDGIKDGITGFAKGLVKTAKDTVSNVVKGVKDLLKINSPSKVFIEIGQGTMEGMEVGIKKDEKNVTNAMGGVIDNLIGGMGGMLQRVATSSAALGQVVRNAQGSLSLSASRSMSGAITRQASVQSTSGASMDDLLNAIMQLANRPTQNQVFLDGQLISNVVSTHQGANSSILALTRGV